MSKVSLTDFTPEVLFTVGDVPIEIAEDYIRKAAIDLCKRAHVVQRRQEIPLWAGVCEYVLEDLPGEIIQNIMKIEYTDGHNCCASRRDEGFLYCSLGCVQVELPNRLFVTPAPQCDAPAGLTVTLSVRPDERACEIASVLYERYHSAIIYGAIWRLLAVPSTPWFNAKVAADYRALANTETASAGVERVLGPVIKPFRIVPRRMV